MSLITSDEIKTFLRIGKENEEYDAAIEIVIAEVEQKIRMICRQPVEQQTMLYQFTGPGKPDKVLRFFPVTDLTKIERYDSVDIGWTEIDDEEYSLLKPNGVYTLHRTTVFELDRVYRATFKVGYATGSNELIQIKGIARDMVITSLKQYDIAGIGKDWLGASSIMELAPTPGSMIKVTPMSPEKIEKQWRERLAPFRAQPE